MNRIIRYILTIATMYALPLIAQQSKTDSIKVDSSKIDSINIDSTQVDSTMVDSSQVEFIDADSIDVDSAKIYLTLADKYADKWDHGNAIINYLKVLEFDSANYRAEWKTGDEYCELANNLPEDQELQKETYFEKARIHSQKAIDLNPEGFKGHLKLATSVGRLALFRGGKEKIKLSKLVKAEAEKALELNPESNIANHILGCWQQNVANLSGLLKFFAKVFFGEKLKGSNEEAVKYFERAIELDPNHIEHYLELAKTYEFMKEEELMEEPLKKILELSDVEEDDPEFKEEAEEMLKKLK